jgi:hypothetical protein
MSNTARTGVWMGRRMPAFRAGSSRRGPRSVPLARYGSQAAAAPRIRFPAAMSRTAARGRGRGAGDR